VRLSDRREAIRHALQNASPDDLILLAGKGHETYQIVGKTKHPFDDSAIARAAVAGIGGRR
jgi:UDP-N-acetylmuramoyl-L-alanyl-D-glutamate--2,6-diaminopimelate ligase